MMASRIEVRRYRRRGEFGSVQELQRRRYLFGICVCIQKLDSEEVPAWAEIQLGALGYTDWQSKFAEHIR